MIINGIKILHNEIIKKELNSNEKYLHRFIIIDCKMFSIRLHCFHSSDPDCMHNHPWDFMSLVLWNGYDEEYEIDGVKNIKRRRWLSFDWHKAEHKHRVILNNKKKTYTLCITGPRKNFWGFFVPDGWVYYKDFNPNNENHRC